MQTKKLVAGMLKKITIYFTIFTTLLIVACGKSGGWLAQAEQTPLIFTEPPQKIALLLPLSGPLKASGQAIRNGFLAAYYYDKQQNNKTLTISILNTTRQDIQNVYQQAVTAGAQVIVGPLTKDDVQALVNMGKLPVPTIALNTLPNYEQNNTDNLFQFGLSPLDEASQLATKIENAKLHRIILISPQGEWGQNIANAFTQQWQQLGGTLVGNFTYPIGNDEDLSIPIRNLLDVNQSEKRAHHLERILYEKFRFVPRRRQDVDGIVLIALPAQARLIRPLLRYYYAGNVPVYSISLLFTPVHSTQNEDLDSIIFCAMPWILLKPESLPSNLFVIRQHIASLWPQSLRRHPELYALGIDAYHLIDQLNQLSQSPQVGFSGATGTLFLTPNGHIFRQLLWAKMINGNPVLLNP